MLHVIVVPSSEVVEFPESTCEVRVYGSSGAAASELDCRLGLQKKAVP